MQNPRQVGWYRVYDQGPYGIQIMHYALDGRPGQCCTIDRDRLSATIEALETPWPKDRPDVQGGFWRRHDEPFSWEGGHDRQT